MARIRSVKPEYWTDRAMSRLPRDARLLYIGLWNIADEWGRLHGDPRFVKGQVFPYDDDLTPDAVDQLLDDLQALGCVQRYEVDSDPYLFLPNLGKHQRLEPAKVASRLPDPPGHRNEQAPDVGENPSDQPSSQSGADSSEPRADSPETNVALHVAGSRVHAAGSKTRARRAETPPRRVDEANNLEPLAAACRDVGLGARFDRIDPDDQTTIAALVDSHGIPALVRSAQAQHRPDNPALFAQAWIPGWQALPIKTSPANAARCTTHTFETLPCRTCAAEAKAGLIGATA